MVALFILLALIVLYTAIVLITWLFAKKVPNDTVLAFTGGLGQGKTLIGVNTALKKLKKARIMWALGWLNDKEMPQLYSNIPIMIKNGLIVRIGYKMRNGVKMERFEFSILLTYEMLTMIDRTNEYSITFIDELGQFADQYSYDNPFVMQYLQFYIRFYRHFIDGYFIYTDQASDNITKPIRVRTNMIHNLNGFRRFLIFFYKVDVLEFIMSEDAQTITSNQLEEPPYFFGHLPFKFFKKLDITRLWSHKKYDSRCYSPLYKDVVFGKTETHAEYKTDYLIDLPNNTEMKKLFKKQGYITQEQMQKYTAEWREIVTKGMAKKKKEPNKAEKEQTPNK